MKYILLVALLFFIVDARLRTHKPQVQEITFDEPDVITATPCQQAGKNGVCYKFEERSCRCANDETKLNCGVGHEKCTGDRLCCLVPNHLDERPTPIQRIDFSEGDTIVGKPPPA